MKIVLHVLKIASVSYRAVAGHFYICLSCLQGWQWQLAAVAVFLAWMDLVLFIRKLPRFGIYVVMFTDILRTFTQFFPVFFLFIVAFGLAFFVLMQNQVRLYTVACSVCVSAEKRTCVHRETDAERHIERIQSGTNRIEAEK